MSIHNSRTLSAATAFIQIKFELLVAFGNLQKCAVTEDKDPEWPSMLREGRLAKALDNAFDSGDEDLGRMCRDTLLELMSIW
jgi:hypothetical protein